MADSNITISSEALVTIGGSTITSFTQGITESNVASVIYENYVASEIGRVRWNWAKTQFSLNKRSDTPLESWDYGYDVPSDLLMLHRVTHGDSDIIYERFKDLIYTDTDNDSDDVDAHYTYRVDENDWPADFKGAIIIGLASRFAFSLARDAEYAMSLNQEAKLLMAEARRNDAQSQTAKRMDVTRLSKSRLLGAGRA